MGLFRNPRRPVVISPVNDEEVERRRAAQHRAALLAQGRGRSVVTGAQGVGTAASNIVRPSALG